MGKNKRYGRYGYKKNPKSPKGVIIFLIALAVIILDQITKKLFEHGFLGIKAVYNTGAGFSILQGNNLGLLFFALMVLGALFYFYDRFPKSRFFYIMIGLAIGGIIGNCIDRIFLGHVIDFIDLGFWPVFNAADSAVVIGGIGAIIYYIRKG